MSLPVLSVRVAFASQPYASSLTWTEIGPAAAAGPGGLGWVRSVRTTRGRQRLLRAQAQFDAGTLAAELDNRDRRFDPTNTSGPYFPNVQPEKVIQVGATWAGTFYPIWTGYVDDWPQSWPGMSEASVPLTATDYFKALGIFKLVSSGYAAQVLADGAARFYRMAEPSGGVCLDAAGGPAAAYTGTVTLGQAGPLSTDASTGVSLQSGSTADGYVTLPAGVPCLSTMGAAGWSIEAWVQPGALTTNASATLNIWEEGRNASGQFSSVVLDATGGLGTTVTVGDGTGTWANNGLPYPQVRLDDGNWHHIVVVGRPASVNYGGAAFTVYVDGVGYPTSFLGGSWPAFYAGQPWLGAGPSGNPNFQGNLCNVAIYPEALTAGQVANHFALSEFPSQTTGSFVNQVLNLLGFPANRRYVDTGYITTQADNQNETQTTALEMLQLLENTEQGQLFMGANGWLNFRDRYSRYTYPAAQPQATLGDGGGAEIPYAMGGVTLNFDRDELYNDVFVTRRNGAQQEASNPASIAAFGDRQMPTLTDFLYQADGDALRCAQWILADTAYPQFRLGQLVLDPTADDRLWPLVLGLEIGQAVTVSKHNIPGGGSISLQARIEGIQHQIDPPKGWKTTWSVSLTGTLPWAILNDPTMGPLSAGNRWGW